MLAKSYSEELRGVQAQDRDQTKRQSQSKVNDTKVNDANANDTNVNDTNANDAPDLGPSLVVGGCLASRQRQQKSMPHQTCAPSAECSTETARQQSHILPKGVSL